MSVPDPRLARACRGLCVFWAQRANPYPARRVIRLGRAPTRRRHLYAVSRSVIGTLDHFPPPFALDPELHICCYASPQGTLEGTPGHMSRSATSFGSPVRRGGFTVLELLVVVAALALLAALVLPALCRAREAARRFQCQNNLHQIGVALSQYHIRHGSLPPGWIEDGTTDTGWGWAAMLLPQLDQMALYDQARFDRPIGDATNEVVRLAELEVFRCPSDAAPRRFELYQDGIGATTASAASSPAAPAMPTVLFELPTANYVGVFGTSDPDTVSGEAGEGAFIANRGMRLSAFRHGLSNTLLVGERTARQLLSTWVGMHPQAEEGPARVVGHVNRAPNDAQADECEFSSRHAGGTLFLMADGAVRFISEDIDRTTYQRMATPRDRP